MKLRMAILTLFVVGVVAVLVVRRQPPSSSSVTARDAGTTEREPARAPAPLPMDSTVRLESLRARALSPYRLAPDRRLLLAVREIRRIAGLPETTVTASFTAGHWSIRCGSRELGHLSELPDFPEMVDLLTEQARNQAWARGWSDNSGPDRPELARALDRLDAPAALREADRAWVAGSRDAALFRDAAHAYALLLSETPDWGGLSDPIAARALATLSYARALGAEDPTRETCWLAQAMGYSTMARDLAHHLPATDPLRLYVMGDARGLERLAAAATDAARASTVAATRSGAPTKPAGSLRRHIAKAAAPARSRTATTRTRTVAKIPPRSKPAAAEAAPGSLEASYFHLLEATSRDTEAWSSLWPSFDLPGVASALVLGSVIRVQGPEASTHAAEALLEGAGRRSSQKPGARSPIAAESHASLADLLQRVDAAADADPHVERGIFLTSDLWRSQRRSTFDAAVERIGRRSLESLDPMALSRWVGVGAPKARAARRGASIQRWFAHLADARVGRANAAGLRADVDSAAAGCAEALQSYEALRLALSPDDPKLREAARGLAMRMDSRPEDRIALGAIARRDLGAFTLAERLGVSDAADGSRSATDEPDSSAGSALARQATAHPTDWASVDRYAAWLERRGDYATARQSVQRWIARTPIDSNAVQSIDARTRLAHLFQLEGHPDQGVRWLGNLHRSGHFGAAERTALILQDLGQANQALAIAWAAHQRTPTLGAGSALLAELFWRQSNPAEAARVLADARASLTANDWKLQIAPRFVACFRSRQEDGVRAAEALLRVGFDDRATFGTLPEALGDAGVDALAFELQSRMRPPGAAGFESAILAYGFLKGSEGEAAALTWLRGRVAEGDHDLVGIVAYQEQHPELLWALAPRRLQGDMGDYHWLLRAATCMAAGPSHPHYTETVDHLGHDGGTYHLEIARYLLGLREEPEVLAMGKTSRQRAEVCYFAGLKAEQRGHMRDAADWYFMSVESDTGNNIESRWAMKRLRQWAARGRPQDRAPAQTPPA